MEPIYMAIGAAILVGGLCLFTYGLIIATVGPITEEDFEHYAKISVSGIVVASLGAGLFFAGVGTKSESPGKIGP